MSTGHTCPLPASCHTCHTKQQLLGSLHVALCPPGQHLVQVGSRLAWDEGWWMARSHARCHLLCQHVESSYLQLLVGAGELQTQGGSSVSSHPRFCGLETAPSSREWFGILQRGTALLILGSPWKSLHFWYKPYVPGKWE